MARYDYECRSGHRVERVFPMGEAPETVKCIDTCSKHARRVFHTPAAIHFKGPGFYQTDVVSTTRRKRRSNPGDDLPREFDRTAARIADAI